MTSRSSAAAGKGRSGEEVTITSEKGLTGNNRAVAMAMAMQGLGVTLVVAASVTEAIDHGRLTRVLPEYDFGAISLEYVLRDQLPSPAARAFVDLLEADFPPQ